MVTFHLPCKKYTKHYLESCFGSPAYLRHDSIIGKYFFQLVSDATDKRLNEIKTDYDSECAIQIRDDLFLRKGFILSKTGTRYFNNFVEEHFKTQIRIMMDTLIEINGIQINQSIEYVYDKFDMDETIFPHETIRKDYQRYRKALQALPIK